ncbi:ROK family transcriptional regulator [Paracoccus liaowanqingii]|uniref:ROK family transcriptional regulator n=1 Tax=Paracoccus liaowanqingii TaxID=2560053 RepID=A0A4P7HP80_9RHOB|nr:ROK family transcriptional regulator [Paracoccus liaowanqingii]QBX35197.1 ROK family transcriptional regulator [Paracoccus liaowanqingii]
MPHDHAPPGPLSRNERLILSLIRRRGPMSRAALAPLTGLSPQAITNLTRKLMQAGFLDAGAVVRGKVGQPSVPLALAPDGAWLLGLKIGRRLAELALVDFTGQVRAHRQQEHAHPDPDRILAFAHEGLQALTAPLSPGQRARIAGLGIAAPYRLWDWGREMAGWRDIDLRARLARDLPYPVFMDNDATTACGAQLIFGATDLPRDFIHIYVAHFAGAGSCWTARCAMGRRGTRARSAPCRSPGGGSFWTAPRSRRWRGGSGIRCRPTTRAGTCRPRSSRTGPTRRARRWPSRRCRRWRWSTCRWW